MADSQVTEPWGSLAVLTQKDGRQMFSIKLWLWQRTWTIPQNGEDLTGHSGALITKPSTKSMWQGMREWKLPEPPSTLEMWASPGVEITVSYCPRFASDHPQGRSWKLA